VAHWLIDNAGEATIVSETFSLSDVCKYCVCKATVCHAVLTASRLHTFPADVKHMLVYKPMCSTVRKLFT